MNKMIKGKSANYVWYDDMSNISHQVYEEINKKRKEIANFLYLIACNMESIGEVKVFDNCSIIFVKFIMKKYNKKDSNKMLSILQILFDNYFEIPFSIDIKDKNSKTLEYYETDK